MRAYEEIAGEPPRLGAEAAPWAASAPRLADRERLRGALAEALDTLLAAHEDSEDALAILCMPAAPPPTPLDEAARDSAYGERGFALSALASLTGCPQIVVPVGAYADEGSTLPLCVSFLARRGRDLTLVKAIQRLPDISAEIRG
mmetsp:Transcript_28244/g.71045  ORF Transcript_28244/g.71045 Transcript_28244/m.71045 type:complete len:145 (-) Transcript_28244:50-484(-)